MKRNSKDEKMQQLTKLYNESLTLFKDPESNRHSKYTYREDRMIWVPVDEPHHIGWEYQLQWSESVKRRSDIDVLQQLLTHLKFDKVGFSKDKQTLKLVRSANKRYTTIRNRYQQWRKKTGLHLHWVDNDYLPNGIVNVYKTKLSAKAFSLIEDRFKPYFYNFPRFVAGTISKAAHYEDCWELTSKFPFEELRVKVSKCYSTHRGIPKVDDLARESEIDHELDSNFYRQRRWPRGDYGGWSAYERKMLKRSSRKRWHSILSEAVGFEEPDLIIDELERRAIKRKY